MNAIETEEEFYSRRTTEKGADRDDLLLNRGLLFQYLANQRSICEALRLIAGLRSDCNTAVLDVACGDVSVRYIPVVISFGAWAARSFHLSDAPSLGGAPRCTS